MKKDESILLRDILKACGLITEFIGEMSFAEFEKDEKTSSAVIRQFEIIEEASKSLSVETTGKCPDIPWKEIAGMRDCLIHGYAGVDLKLVWDPAKNDLGDLKPKIASILT